MRSGTTGGRFLRALLSSPLILHSRSVDHAPFHRAITFAKNFRISSSRRSGCSRAANCPPFSIRVYLHNVRGRFGPAQRTGKHLFWEIRKRHRNRHPGLRLLSFASQAIFTLNPHGRARGIGDPVERDIGKKGVAVDRSEKIAVIVRALLKYIHYPGQPPDRRISASISQSLRLAVLDEGMAAFFP